MRRGKPRAKFFLRWDGYDSFFDDNVQRLLLQVHPEKVSYPSDALKGYAVEAWNRADGFAVSRSEVAWMRLLPFMRQNPVWHSELLAAVFRYYQAEAQRSADPLNALAAVKRWRTERYLRETSEIKHTHAQVVKFNTLLKRGVRPRTRGAAPAPLEENVRPPTDRSGYLDGNRPTSETGIERVHPGTYRSAVKRENAARDKIMRHWAESWMVHLLGSSVTETAEKSNA